MSDIATGTKHDENKIRYDLLPPEALVYAALAFTYGAKKYGDRNWENGISVSRLYRATFSHLFKWFIGIDNDEESGLPHLAHAMASLMMLVATTTRRNLTLYNKRFPIDKEFIDKYIITEEK